MKRICCNSEPALTPNVMKNWPEIEHSILQVPQRSTMLLCTLLKHLNCLQYIAKQTSDLWGVQTNKEMLVGEVRIPLVQSQN